MRFELKHFDELSIRELYAALVLRQRVFVVEQHCAFVDCDGLDQLSWHLMYLSGTNELRAYCRLLPPGLAYPGYASIGRVVSEPLLRREGFGRELMTQAIENCRELFGPVPIKISAQVYLTKFYASFGFEVQGGPYIEDFIEHIAMTRHWQKN